MQELFFNQIGVAENSICINDNGLFCLEFMSQKVITIQVLELLLILIVPVSLTILFINIFKKK